MSAKESIRRQVRERLRSMPIVERNRAGAHIASTVWEVPEARSARTILLYASMGDEAPTPAIAEEARRRGIEILYPRCLPDQVSMTLHAVDDDADLTPGRFGLLEPAIHCPPVEVATVDLAFIPGLAWDRGGRRLGRGAGYYDRLLAAPDWRGLRCGLFFSIQEFPELPADPWDMPLDLVVTEKEIVVIGAGA